MENLDFEGKTSNEILEELAQAAEWLRDQYTNAKPLLPTSIAIAADSDDVQAAFFWQANRKHLPVLIDSTRHVKTPETHPSNFVATEIIAPDGTVYPQI